MCYAVVGFEGKIKRKSCDLASFHFQARKLTTNEKIYVYGGLRQKKRFIKNEWHRGQVTEVECAVVTEFFW